jgi:drug/metabolite transporter (DMT)-like permease
MKRSRIAFLFLAFTFCWIITEAMAAQSGVSLYEVVWARYAVHIAAMLLIFGPRSGKTLVQSPHMGLQIGRSLLMLGMPVFFIWAIHRTPMNNAIDILWLTPILIIILDRLFTREVPGWTVPTMTLVGYAGVVLIVRPSFTFDWSILFALGASVCFALYIIMTRTMRDEMFLPKMFHTALWVFLALTPFLPFFWQIPTLHGLIALIAVGLFGWVALFLLGRSIDEVPPAIFAPVLYSIVLWPELFQGIARHVVPNHAAWLGSLLVIGSIGTTLLIGWRPPYQREI